MTIIHDITCFLVLFQSEKYDFDKTEQYVFRSFKEACDKANELVDDFGGETQIIEFNHTDGYSSDVTPDLPEPEEERPYVDPNDEHRLTKEQVV
jgi:hypothetical protein